MSRVRKRDKYDGMAETKTRFINLFYIAKMNISDYVSASKKYREYLVKTLKLIGRDRDETSIDDYYNIADRILKITEIDNIYTLTRLLFNALTAFDALKSYIWAQLKKCEYFELKDFMKTFKTLLNAKIFDTDKDFDLGTFLHDVRNTYLHDGAFVAKLTNIPSGRKNEFVPCIAIMISEIWTTEYLKENGIEDDYAIDTLEVFEKYSSVFNDLEKIINEII